MTDTGESTATINARADANAWPRVYVALTQGAVLYRPHGLSSYYTKCRDDRDPNDGMGISARFVKYQAKHGCLVRIGVDTYGIDDSRRTRGAPDPQQLKLF